ncbi:cystathionine gamma-lyase [Caenorhabditis elegans]|uniref:Cystathionine gamma-lyase n=1 Tax=Caenorhabditis elegans TaxID=6239 RepID=A5JYW2_CAEEL|nr:cystathionine gamma-lyase [Caenorhabditis elegans]CAN86602.1 cystathionine gamma-lyase [Caenorhabditis elegans]|eukprot:NP_001122419.1 Cystathionine Beta Lyase [Caenorhabditis elegans]
MIRTDNLSDLASARDYWRTDKYISFVITFQFYLLLDTMSDSFNWPAGNNEARERLGEKFESLHLDSRISTSHAKPLSNADPVVVPIYHSSTYRFKTVDQFNEDNHGANFVYRRCGNPTTENVEVVINEIEGGAGSLLYNSGLAAISAVFLEFLSSGAHMIVMNPIYSDSYMS